MTVRAKFIVESIANYIGGSSTVNLRPVHTGEENKAFWQATPSGKIELYINNSSAAALFQVGEEYYIDFTRVEPSGDSL